MKVLSIGNSFSQDAQRYLHQLAEQEGVDLLAVNLYIGACSLDIHDKNLKFGDPAYSLEINGESTGKFISIPNALCLDEWDVITLQQASHYSANFETYTPYLEEIAAHIKKVCPSAKLFIHETWGYENGSEKLQNAGFSSYKEMQIAVLKAYEKAVKVIDADGVIPSGRVMLCASEMGIKKIHRDTFHAALGVGRYVLALTWYKALTGKDITNNRFDNFDEPISESEREIAIHAVKSAFQTF
ncbi:MAG: DUF4886 domain-containing protein [Clostridia bacterium]|nr:DUF4886 domain-containing protein [Clostridia bacterium]